VLSPGYDGWLQTCASPELLDPDSARQPDVPFVQVCQQLDSNARLAHDGMRKHDEVSLLTNSDMSEAPSLSPPRCHAHVAPAGRHRPCPGYRSGDPCASSAAGLLLESQQGQLHPAVSHRCSLEVPRWLSASGRAALWTGRQACSRVEGKVRLACTDEEGHARRVLLWIGRGITHLVVVVKWAPDPNTFVRLVGAAEGSRSCSCEGDENNDGE
jgi:hypothetical protein